MSSKYLIKDAIIRPMQGLLRAALAHPALFETEEDKVTSLILPCTPVPARATPLRAYRPNDLHSLREAGEDGYTELAAPLSRLFSSVPPLLTARPFRLSVTFTQWQQIDGTRIFLPIDIGPLTASVSGANFMATTPDALARQLTHYLSEHEGIKIEGDLLPWHFDAPEIAIHIEPYQGLLADTARNALARLASLSRPIRAFVQDGGEITTKCLQEDAEAGESGVPEQPNRRRRLSDDDLKRKTKGRVLRV